MMVMVVYQGQECFTFNGAAECTDMSTVPGKATDNGTIGKLTVSYAPTDDMLLYATISEGYRAGFLNRPGGYTSECLHCSLPSLAQMR